MARPTWPSGCSESGEPWLCTGLLLRPVRAFTVLGLGQAGWAHGSAAVRPTRPAAAAAAWAVGPSTITDIGPACQVGLGCACQAQDSFCHRRGPGPPNLSWLQSTRRSLLATIHTNTNSTCINATQMPKSENKSISNKLIFISNYQQGKLY